MWGVECPLTLCIYPYNSGISIQWEASAYTVSESNETVQLMLLKVGSTVSNVSVQVMTVAGSATGETGQAG